eukprot:8604067-Pyramimonas_sp.AAC.2
MLLPSMTQRGLQTSLHTAWALNITSDQSGRSVLPQLRQLSDPLEVLELVLAHKAAPHHPPRALMRLARLLGLGSPGRVAEVELLLAQSASDAGDPGMAAELCGGLAVRDHAPAWRLCADLVRAAVSIARVTSASRVLH